MKKSISYRKTFIVGFGFLGIQMLWPVFNNFVPILLQAGNPEFERQLLEAGRDIPKVVGLGLSPALALFIMTWDNIINVFVQPWVGLKSDQTWNRFGRRKPWMMVGAPVAAIAFVMIPLANTVLAIMVFILITNFGMALFRAPTSAWLGDLFPPNQRSQANGVINLTGGLGAAIALLASGPLFDKFGRMAPFLFVSVMMLAVLSVAVIYVKEPEKIAGDKDREVNGKVWDNLREVWTGENRSGIYVLLAILFWFMGLEAVQTGLSSFAVFTLGLTPGTASVLTTLFAASFILAAVPSGLVAGRIGRKRTINFGLAGLVLLFSLGYFFIQDQITLGIVLVAGGILWALVNVSGLPLVFDYGDESKIGVYTGLYYFSAQSAAVLGPVLSGVMVESLDSEYRWLWIFGAVFMAFSWMALQAVREKANN